MRRLCINCYPVGKEMNTEIRKATLADSDQVFSLVEGFASSFNPERKAFDHYTFYANGRVTWIEEIMIHEDLRGKGIGRQLMKSVEKWAVSRESRLIGLATRRSAPFYSAIGYEESAIFFRKMIESKEG